LIGQRRVPGLKLRDDRMIRLPETPLHPGGFVRDWTTRPLHSAGPADLRVWTVGAGHGAARARHRAGVSDAARGDLRRGASRLARSAVGVYRPWRDGGYAVSALLASVLADVLGVPWAIGAIAVPVDKDRLRTRFERVYAVPAQRAGLAGPAGLPQNLAVAVVIDVPPLEQHGQLPDGRRWLFSTRARASARSAHFSDAAAQLLEAHSFRACCAGEVFTVQRVPGVVWSRGPERGRGMGQTIRKAYPPSGGRNPANARSCSLELLEAAMLEAAMRASPRYPMRVQLQASTAWRERPPEAIADRPENRPIARLRCSHHMSERCV